MRSCDTIGSMGKYNLLAQWLTASGEDAVSMTFDEITDVLGLTLPESGKRYQAFWSNPTLAVPLASAGFRARLKLAEARVEFVAIVGKPLEPFDPRSTVSSSEYVKPDFILVGCVKTKLTGRHQAQDIYQSGLLIGRRRYAESVGVPWFILSAHHGLIAPDDEIDSYDVSLLALAPSERAEWGRRVLSDVDRRIGSVSGKIIEIHAGAEYREYGVRRGLESRGARVAVPLGHLNRGEQLAWYKAKASGFFDDELRRDEHAPVQPAPVSLPEYAHRLAAAVAREFFEGTLDLSARPSAPVPGWAAMPECVAVKRLVADGATPVDVRIVLTLVAAMDRARDADRLWENATRLFRSARWVYQPQEALIRPLFELRDALAVGGVSQRHGADSAAWRLILEAIESEQSPEPVRRAIFGGAGDAAELMRCVSATRSSGQPWFPLLRGPKVSVLWIRMLADPGAADIQNIAALPVAVDVQVRKVTEYLGITQTAGRDLDAIRGEIKEAWSMLAGSAVGSPGLAGTCAALDPALWFFGKWGCTFCQRARKRMPISTACSACTFDELSRTTRLESEAH